MSIMYLSTTVLYEYDVRLMEITISLKYNLNHFPAVDGSGVKSCVAVSLTVKNAAKLFHPLHDVVATAEFFRHAEGKLLKKVRYATRIRSFIPSKNLISISHRGQKKLLHILDKSKVYVPRSRVYANPNCTVLSELWFRRHPEPVGQLRHMRYGWRCRRL